MTRIPARRLEQASFAGTLVFAGLTLIAVLFDGPERTVFALVAIALFLLGCIAFLFAFFAGVERSRTEEVSVAGLYLLMGSVPRETRIQLHGLTASQVVIGVAGASIRPFTALAFGILVPMFGMGVSGLWAAGYGVFPSRSELDHKRPKHARPAEGDTDG